MESSLRRRWWSTPVLTGMPLVLLTHFHFTSSAAEASSTSSSWHAQTLSGALGMTALFAIFGIFLAILGYKLFDAFTPGHLHKEIIENKNTAAALIGAAVIIGVCIIIAAAMVG